MDIINEFVELLDKNLDEQVYQEYLENHTELIPTKDFELNHGVHDDLIIRKMPIGQNYISDFCYLSKNSGEWNIVFIELEKPCKKLFNKDGKISKELNIGLSQISNWKAHFSDNINREAFIKNTVISEIMSINSLKNNPYNFKFILVIGRRKQLEENNEYNKKFHLLGGENTKIITYDSLYESINQKSKKYLGIIKNQKLYIKNSNYISSILFQWMNPNYIYIKQSLYNELENYKNPPSSNFGNFHYNNLIKATVFDTLKNNIFKD